MLKGILIGMIIAIPSGPMGLLCLNRILSHKRSVGLVSGVGVALAESIYSFLAALGVSSIGSALSRHHRLLYFVGGFFVVWIGIDLLKRQTPPPHVASLKDEKTLLRYFISTFLFALANPLLMLSFAALFAVLGLGKTNSNLLFTTMLAAGIFIGSCLSWVTISYLSESIKKWMNPKKIQLIKSIFGIIALSIGLFSIFRDFVPNFLSFFSKYF